MNVDQLIDLEIRVREEVAALEKEIQAAEAHAAPPGALDGTEGRLSRQDSLMNHEIARQAQRRRHQRLDSLRQALKRMDQGTYGFCANCGKEIEDARLQSQPDVLICSACA